MIELDETFEEQKIKLGDALAQDGHDSLMQNKDKDHDTIKYMDNPDDYGYVDSEKAISIDPPDPKGFTWGRVPVVATTLKVDRHGEVVKPNGVKLTNFKKNPAVSILHFIGGFGFGVVDPLNRLAIGKVDINSIVVTDKKITCDMLFNLTLDPETGEPMEKMAREIFNRFNSGTTKAVSIGFKSIERTEKQEFKEQTGVTHKVWEWVELSVVGIGANADAVAKELPKLPLNEQMAMMRGMLNMLDSDNLTRMENYISDERDIRGYVKKSLPDSEMNALLSLEFVLERLSHHTKAGAVLSAANLRRVKEAMQTLLDLIASAEKEKPDKPKKELETLTFNQVEQKYEYVSAEQLIAKQNDPNIVIVSLEESGL
jgi:hypothetical protein